MKNGMNGIEKISAFAAKSIAANALILGLTKPYIIYGTYTALKAVCSNKLFLPDANLYKKFPY